MNQNFWIHYPQNGRQMLRPPSELPFFERNKTREQKIKYSYSL
jgi:hypothetical protein